MTTPFGWSLHLDLRSCRVPLDDAPLIERFVAELCDDVLQMRRYGPLMLEWFGAAQPHTEGYSLVQLIETSSVVGHLSPHLSAVYLDIFSCQRFDPDQVTKFSADFFQAESSAREFLTRQ